MPARLVLLGGHTGPPLQKTPHLLKEVRGHLKMSLQVPTEGRDEAISMSAGLMEQSEHKSMRELIPSEARDL